MYPIGVRISYIDAPEESPTMTSEGTANTSKPKTLFEKIWESHVVREVPGQSTILYIDRHLVHEVTSSQGFEGLRLEKRPVRRRDATFSLIDHNIPTTPIGNYGARHNVPIIDPQSALQIATLEQNAQDFG